MSILVGRKAPDFTAAAVMANGEIKNNYNFYEAIKNKYALLFFYPLDFTFVCPSELIALHNRIEKFRDLNVEVVAVSIDSQFTHNAWRNTELNAGGIGQVDYTLVADVKHEICQAYGIEHPEAGVAFRGAFFIDKTQIVRFQNIYDLPLGRNIDELLRSIEGWQFFETHGEVCPAGWKKGDKGMHPNPKGVAEYLSQHGEKL